MLESIVPSKTFTLTEVGVCIPPDVLLSQEMSNWNTQVLSLLQSLLATEMGTNGYIVMWGYNEGTKNIEVYIGTEDTQPVLPD